MSLLFDIRGSFLRLAAGRSLSRAGGVTRAIGGSACSGSHANERVLRARAAQLLRVSRRPAASRRNERVRTKAPHRHEHCGKRLRIKHVDMSRQSRRARRGSCAARVVSRVPAAQGASANQSSAWSRAPTEAIGNCTETVLRRIEDGITSARQRAAAQGDSSGLRGPRPRTSQRELEVGALRMFRARRARAARGLERREALSCSGVTLVSECLLRAHRYATRTSRFQRLRASLLPRVAAPARSRSGIQ